MTRRTLVRRARRRKEKKGRATRRRQLDELLAIFREVREQLKTSGTWFSYLEGHSFICKDKSMYLRSMHCELMCESEAQNPHGNIKIMVL